MMMALTQLPPPTPLTLGPGAQIVLKLIDQLPQIIGAIGLLLTAVVGLLNFRRLGQVQTQTDGHMTAMIQKQAEMANLLSNSVPAAALTAVVSAGAAAATAAASTHASDRAADRMTDRAADRAAAVIVNDRRSDTPLKVAIVSTPEMAPSTEPAGTEAIAKSLENIDANTAATAEGVQNLKDPMK